MTSKMKKVSLVVSNLSSGMTIRAYVLALALKRLGYDVEIAGFLYNERLFAEPPLGVKLFSLRGEIYPRFFVAAHRLLQHLDGDIIYALKARPTSFGLSLLKRRFVSRPLILDMDDWSLSWYGGDDWRYEVNLRELYRDIFKRREEGLRFPDAPLYLFWMEKLVGRADALTVDTDFLKSRFGGIYLPNGSDTTLFDPSRFNPVANRARLGLGDYRVIMFGGIPRPHKGLEDVLTALEMLAQPDLRLVIVGSNPYDNYEKRLVERWGRWIIQLPGCPYTQMPEVLSAAHIIAVCQRDTPGARAQFPLKLADGMSMAKPVLSTKVGDIPAILGGTGYIVEPERPDKIASMIRYIFENYPEAEENGRRARQRCIQFYSIEAISNILSAVIQGLEQKF